MYDLLIVKNYTSNQILLLILKSCVKICGSEKNVAFFVVVKEKSVFSV